MSYRIYSFMLLLASLIAWEAFCRLGAVSELIVPAPSAVGVVLWQSVTSGYLWPHIWVTSVEMALGLALGAAMGFGCGVVLSEAVFIKRLLWPYIIASQVVPKLALAPLFIVWFGFGMTSTVIITALICFFPLLENTITGLTHVDPNKQELFRMLGASRAQILWRLRVPTGMPVILAGLRVAVVLALVGAVVGEFIGGREGLGATIIAAQAMMDSTLMFAVLFVITTLGIAFYQSTVLVESWLLRRHKQE
jgi:NitT/TauT family transport system permease protein